MNKRYIILILSILLIAPISQIRGIMYTPRIQVTASNIYLTAGQENQIKLEFENSGDFDIFEVQAIISSTTPGISVISSGQKIWNVIEEEDEVSWKPTLFVNPEVPLGTYGLTLVLTYIKMFQTGATLNEQSTIQVGVIVNRVNFPKLKYVPPQKDIYLYAGSYANISYSLENFWDQDIKDLEISVKSPTHYISIIEGITHNLERLESNESININLRLYINENTQPGEYFLETTAYYNDRGRNRYYQTFSVPMTLDSVGEPRVTIATINKVETDPEIINPGHTFDLNLEVEISGAKAFDVMTVLVIPTSSPLSPLSPTIIRLGDLSPGERNEARYRMLVDGSVEAGPYSLTVTLNYIDSKGLPQTTTETLTVLIEGIVDFSLLDNDVIELQQGSSNEIESDLLLIGTESVRFVELELIEDSALRRVSGSNEYIGAVDPDSPIPFDINVGVKDDADLGEQLLKLRVKYLDHLNRDKEDTINVQVTIVERSSEIKTSSGGGIWIWFRRLLGITP